MENKILDKTMNELKERGLDMISNGLDLLAFPLFNQLYNNISDSVICKIDLGGQGKAELFGLK